MSSVDCNINNFIAVAERFNGVKEGTSQHTIILALYNSSKPKGEYEMTSKDPWCAAFIGAVSGGCGFGDIIPISASVDRMRSAMLSCGAKAVSVPERGDIVFFSQHVGIVVSVDGTEVTTIEGNYSDSVSHRKFNYKEAVVSFYRPDWGRESSQSTEVIEWSKYRDYYSELTWDEKTEIKTFPTLRMNSKGIYVKILQDFLGVDTDGIFGEDTSASLILYQKRGNLEPDGICGKQTWSSFFA